MIRLLPRTPRGTWLLAGAVWLAGVGALWCSLPERPRAEWNADGNKEAIGFVPGTATFAALTAPGAGDPQVRRLETCALTLWDADSGGVRTLSDIDSSEPAISPDGRWITLINGSGDERNLRLYEVGTLRPVADLPRADRQRRGCGIFSDDGGTLVYGDRIGDNDIVRVIDVASRKQRLTVDTGNGRLALSPDGRALAQGDNTVQTENRATPLRLWDLSTGRELRHWTEPDSCWCHQLQFSPDGRFLVAVFEAKDKRGSWSFPLRIWAVADGREVLHIEAGSDSFPRHQPWFLSFLPHHRTKPLDVWWYDGRLADFRTKLDEFDAFPFGRPVGGRTLTVWKRRPEPNRIAEWLASHGFRLPFTEKAFTERESNLELRLLDIPTGRRLGGLWLPLPSAKGYIEAVVSSDGGRLAILTPDSVSIWDVPPRKSVAWFAVGAILVSLPILGIARRRVRHLRRAAIA